MASQYSCQYCDKTFHFKDNYDNHFPTCEYFHRSKKERLHSLEAMEAIPSPQEMFHLIQYLSKTCRQLEEEVTKLKNTNYTYIRKSITYQLKNVQPPKIVYDIWIKTFPVTTLHLETVFKPLHTLVDGIKHVLTDVIKVGDLLPVRTFKEKPNVMYVYTLPGTWCVANSHHWHRLLDSICHEFVKVFCAWEDDHQEILANSITDKNKHITYLVKLAGPSALKEKQKSELKTWFLQQLGGK